MTRLLIATRNTHKTREFAQMLGPDFELRDLQAYPEIREVVEDGATFAENARRKAEEVSRQLPGLILADDSGLEVDSLGGAPGIYSARYAGEKAGDEQNRRKLLATLAGSGTRPPWVAQFRCALALAQAGTIFTTVEGSVEGEVTGDEHGADGFGYDSIFRPLGFDRTFAQFSGEEKNAISHRAKAVNQLRRFLSQTDLNPR